MDAQDAMGVSAAHMAVDRLPPATILALVAAAPPTTLASRDPRGRSAAETYIQRLLAQPGLVDVRAWCVGCHVWLSLTRSSVGRVWHSEQQCGP